MSARAAPFHIGVFFILALTLSCNRAPTTPTPSGGRQPPETVIRVELIAPRSLAPGTAVQLRLIAHRLNGTTEDVTASATWFYGDSRAIVTVSNDGLVTAMRVGEATIFGNYGTYSNHREIVVVADGTFRLRGQIVEEDTPSLGVADAWIEADGFGALFSDSQGFYQMYGVPPQTVIRVSKAGYVTREQSLTISDHHTLNVPLALVTPRLDISGNYELVIEANPACRGRIPDALLTRRYTAEIPPHGALVTGRASGAAFVRDRNIFVGSAEPGRATVEFFYDPYYSGGPLFLEVLDDATYFGIVGKVPLSPLGRGFAGTLDGELMVFHGDPDIFLPGLSCRSTHRLSLNR